MLKYKKPKLNNILGEGDLQAIGDLMGGLLDKQAAVLASKKDLQAVEQGLDGKIDSLETSLKEYMDQGFESVMSGIDIIAEKLTEKEKFERLVAWAREVGEKVGVKPKV